MWVSLEGLISCGKSTLIDKVISKLDNVQIIPEPVDEWEASGILKKSYTDPLYTFPAQCEFFTSRIRTIRSKYDPTKINISERSPFSDVFFWNIQSVDPLLHLTYLNMWTEWQNLLPVRNPNLFIYLVTSTETCMRRIKERGRDSEQGITVSYMESLHDQHEMYLSGGQVKMPDGTLVPCITIDSTQNYRDDELVADELCKTIQRILKGVE
jgi:deoxyadenosine/deoxycytidine kinase